MTGRDLPKNQEHETTRAMPSVKQHSLFHSTVITYEAGTMALVGEMLFFAAVRRMSEVRISPVPCGIVHVTVHLSQASVTTA